MPEIEVIVASPGGKPILVVDKETGKLLLFTITYNKKIQPGRYTKPEDVVQVFIELATRGHETKRRSISHELLYRFIVAFLLTDAPQDEKLEQVKRYVREAIK